MLRRGLQQLFKCTERSALQLRGVKDTTYLKGISVDPNAEKTTPEALRDLLDYVQQKIPDGVEYRKHVETYCNRFLKIIEDSPSQGDAEKTLGRQYEEIQMDVESERGVIETMSRWQPWDAKETPRLYAEYKDIPQNVLRFREFQHALGLKGSEG